MSSSLYMLSFYAELLADEGEGHSKTLLCFGEEFVDGERVHHAGRCEERGLDACLIELLDEEFAFGLEHFIAADRDKDGRIGVIVVSQCRGDVAVVTRCIAQPIVEFGLVEEFLAFLLGRGVAPDAEDRVHFVVVDVGVAAGGHVAPGRVQDGTAGHGFSRIVETEHELERHVAAGAVADNDGVLRFIALVQHPVPDGEAVLDHGRMGVLRSAAVVEVDDSAAAGRLGVAFVEKAIIEHHAGDVRAAVADEDDVLARVLLRLEDFRLDAVHLELLVLVAASSEEDREQRFHGPKVLDEVDVLLFHEDRVDVAGRAGDLTEDGAEDTASSHRGCSFHVLLSFSFRFAPAPPRRILFTLYTETGSEFPSKPALFVLKHSKKDVQHKNTFARMINKCQ